MVTKKIKIYMSVKMRNELKSELVKIDDPASREFCENLLERFDKNLEKNKERRNELLRETEAGFEHQEVDDDTEYMFLIDCPVAVREYVKRDELTFIPFKLEEQILMRMGN